MSRDYKNVRRMRDHGFEQCVPGPLIPKNGIEMPEHPPEAGTARAPTERRSSDNLRRMTAFLTRSSLETGTN